MERSSHPDTSSRHKLTDQHKKWIENSLKSIVCALLANSSGDRRGAYIDDLLFWYRKDDLTEQNKEALLQTAMMIDPDFCTGEQKEVFLDFSAGIMTGENSGLKVAAPESAAISGGRKPKALISPNSKAVWAMIRPGTYPGRAF